MSSNTPLVSILIPTYGRAKYLGDIVHRLLKQTYKNFEIIITDDASPDDTEHVISEFLSDCRVKYIKREKNLGAYLNYYRSLCFDAKGELAFYHSDDDYIVDDSWLQDSVNIMLSNKQIGLVHSGYALFFDDTKNTKEIIIEADVVVSAEQFIYRFTPDDQMVHTFLFNRLDVSDYIMSNINWNQANYMHMLESIFSALKGKLVGYIRRVTMHYRIHNYQQTLKENRRELEHFTPTAIQYIKLLDVMNDFYGSFSDIDHRLKVFFNDIYHGFVGSYRIAESQYVSKCATKLQQSSKVKIIYGVGMLGQGIFKKCRELSIHIDMLVDDKVREFDGKYLGKLDDVLADIAGEKLIVIATLSQDIEAKMLQNIYSSECYTPNIDEIFSLQNTLIG
jgi:glycosyltransferase involved in cell wall biosynthesis